MPECGHLGGPPLEGDGADVDDPVVAGGDRVGERHDREVADDGVRAAEACGVRLLGEDQSHSALGGSLEGGHQPTCRSQQHARQPGLGDECGTGVFVDVPDAREAGARAWEDKQQLGVVDQHDVCGRSQSPQRLSCREQSLDPTTTDGAGHVHGVRSLGREAPVADHGAT